MARTKTKNNNITKFTKENVARLHQDIKKLLNDAGLGAAVGESRCTYSSNVADFKLTFTVISTEGVAFSQERENFKTYAGMSTGLDASWLDRTFKVKGVEYTVTGLKVGRGAYKVIATSDGKEYLLPIDIVIACISSPDDPMKVLREKLRKEARQSYIIGTHYLGLKEEWLDKTFDHQGLSLRIVGVKTKGRGRNAEERVYCANAKDDTQAYLIPVDAVIKAMGAVAAAA